MKRRPPRLLAANPALRFVGLHSHIGSQIYEPAAFAANAEALVDAAARFAASGLTTEEIVIGGGFGLQMHPEAEDEWLDVAATIGETMKRSKARAAELKISAPRVGVEPGRALVGHAGTTLYTVCAVKPQNVRTFVVVDGGIAENPRPAIYGAYHHVVAADRTIAAKSKSRFAVARARTTSSGWRGLPRDLQAGELLAMCTTGAYTYSMASNYNRFPRPAVVAVENGSHRLLIRRERSTTCCATTSSPLRGCIRATAAAF